MHAAVVPDEHAGVPRHRVIARHLRSRSMIAERRLAWATQPSRFPRAVEADASRLTSLVHEQRVPLRRGDAGAEVVFEEGKRINVGLAAPALDGALLEPGAVFSFWRAVGKPSASLGFRYGMELRGGCVVPALGGGLCLLSNALFRAAAELGWTIVERHGHTMEVVPSADDPWGVDATVAWPYVDLRVTVPVGDAPARLHARIDGDHVLIAVYAERRTERAVRLEGVDDRVEVVDGQRVRRNRIVRHVTTADGAMASDTIAVNAKRLLVAADVGRSCLTCGLDDCAGRVTIR